MATLLQLDRGHGTLLIPDADGEEHEYLFRPCAPGISLAAWQITRVDTGSQYRVSCDRPGRWSCSCPAQEFRKRGTPDCKHILALMDFWLWLQQYRQLDPYPRLHTPMEAIPDQMRR